MGRNPTLRIFIGYRRDDSQGFARSIHDRLALRFGEDAVFRDINDIEPGTPWEESIDEALGTCDVFVLLIGPRWLEATDDEGNRRIDNPADRHRREIETAIDRRIRMFVALMEDAQMPSRKQLPARAEGAASEGLQKVPSLHALRIADHAFDYGIGELVSSIDTAVEHARAAAEREGAARESSTEVNPERERAAVEPEPVGEAPREAPREERSEQGRPSVIYGRPSRTGRWIGIAAAAAVGAVVVLLFLTVLSGDEEGATGPAEVIGSPVEVGRTPMELATAENGIWVTDRAGNTYSLIEVLADGQSLGEQFPTDQAPEGIAVGGESVWVANRDIGTVSRFDPDTGDLVGEFPVGENPGGVAVSDDAAWVANSGGDTVSRVPLEGADDESVESFAVESAPYGVAIGNGLVWVTNRDSNSVSRLPIEGGDQLDPIAVGANPKGVDVSGDEAWVANTDSDTVTRIDVQTQATEEFPIGNQPRDVVIAFGSVWVTLGEDDELARLNPESGEVDQLIEVGDGPEGITADSDSIWVANGLDGTVVRVRP